MNLGLIGTGNMAEAMISGLLKKNSRRQSTLKASEIFGFDLNPKRLQFIKKKYKIKTTKSITELIKKSNVVILAVKPQNIQLALEEISYSVKKNHLIISIAAGITTRTIEKIIGSHVRLIRVMPNTPALIGKGMSAYYLNKNTKPSDKKVAEKILSSIGNCLELKNEKLLDTVTAISGSGPAYVFTFIDALIKSGLKLGLKEKDAKTLASQTVLGAASLLQESHDKTHELIQKVSSKGGTTEAGLKKLKQEGFYKVIDSCVKAAHKRSKELSQS